MRIEKSVMTGHVQKISTVYSSESGLPPRLQQHVVDCFLSFLDNLGICEKEYKWHLPEFPGAGRLAQQVLTPGTPRMIISPCSSHELRNWHAEGYAALADHAAEQHGMQVIICGGSSPVEYLMADEIIRFCQTSEPVNLVGKDTFGEYLELLRRATVLVTPDSGPYAHGRHHRHAGDRSSCSLQSAAFRPL